MALGPDLPMQLTWLVRNLTTRDTSKLPASQRCTLMPVQIDTNGIGAQIPTEKYGVRSPFHAGGGGGGGGGGSGAATQVLDGGSNTVPHPHSIALPTAGEIMSQMQAVSTRSRRQLPNDELSPRS